MEPYRLDSLLSSILRFKLRPDAGDSPAAPLMESVMIQSSTDFPGENDAQSTRKVRKVAIDRDILVQQLIIGLLATRDSRRYVMMKPETMKRRGDGIFSCCLCWRAC